jgi:hypothetical protein
MTNVPIQLQVVAKLWVLDRRDVEAISDVTIHPTGPQDQVKKNPYRQVKATRHFAAAVVPGAAVPTIATINIHIVCPTPPHSRIVRLPI